MAIGHLGATVDVQKLVEVVLVYKSELVQIHLPSMVGESVLDQIQEIRNAIRIHVLSN
jgi:hypothetical protein